VAQVGATPGVERAEPLAEFQGVARLPDGKVEPINVLAQTPGGIAGSRGGPGAPAAGEAFVSERLDAGEGDMLVIGGRRLRVAKVVDGMTYFAGSPTVRVNFADARAIGFYGRPLASAIVTRGVPARAPAGFAVLSRSDVEADVRKPVVNAAKTIDGVRLVMWIVAALIIGAVTYLSALERVRDFAVLKAVGGSSRSLAASLMVQAVLAALLAAVLAIGLAQLMRPVVTVPVVIGPSAICLLLVVAALVGVISSLAALRRAIGVDPALAFSG
jgi:putative ABC transport system permease protein